MHGKARAPGSLIEHAAQGRVIHSANLHTKTDNPAGMLVHDYHDPVSGKQDRLASKQIDAPQTVFPMTYQGQP